MRVVFLVVVSALIMACRTVPNVSPPPIQVPRGLSANDVELAVLLAIADRPAPAGLTPGQRITDNLLVAVLPTYEAVDGPSPWFFETREPGIVFAGYQRRKFYMRVAVRYSAELVTVEIVESRNLRQTKTRIHKSSFVWLQALESRVRRTLGELARRERSG